MDAPTWRRRITTLSLLMGALLIGAAGAQAELTGKGDTVAWEELKAAFKKLNSLSGYRTKTTVKISAGTGITITTIAEHVPPDAFHSTSRTDWGTSEIVHVNEQLRYRASDSGNRWRCGTTSARASREAIDAGQGTVDVSRAPATTIEGAPVRTYVWDVTLSGPGPNRSVKRTSYVGSETGLPRRTVQVTTTREVSTDYYDYGANIGITLPPCG